jgi:hypothetical protein
MASVENEIKVIKIAKAISEVISEKFGHKIETNVDVESISERGKRIYFNMGIAQNFGIFEMVIQKAELSVAVEDVAGSEEDMIWVKVNLDYDHPGGGSNGYEIARIWLSKSFKVLEKRFSKN